jgi:hypothetical protein
MSGKLNMRGTIRDRMKAYTMIDDAMGCWNWVGSKTGNGYGNIHYNGKSRPAHRIMWELEYGDIPIGMDLDHLCRNPKCVNPNHLEVVTRSENLRRSPLVGKNKRPRKEARI